MAEPQTVAAPRAQTARTFTILLLLMTVALLLRVWMSADDGLWLDEGYSVWLAEQPYGAMLERIVTTDQHPPLYYSLLWLWRWGGDSEAYLRLLSAIFGVLTVPVLYLLGQRLLNRPAGLAAALLFTVSPFNIRYAQEVRMYTLLMLLAALALLSLAGWLTTPHNEYTKIGRWRRRKTDLWAAGYLFFTWLTLLTHNTAIFLPLAANGFVLGWYLSDRWRARSRRAQPATRAPAATYPRLVQPARVPWLVAQAGLLLLWLLWLPAFWQQAAQVYARFWIPAPTMQTIVDAWQALLSAYQPDAPLGSATLWLVAGSALLLGIGALRRAPAQLGLLIVLALTPFAGELLVSLRRPIFAERTLIWAATPLWLIMAAGMTALRPRLAGGALLATLVVINLLSAQNYYTTFRREEWRAAAAYVAARAEPGDLVLFHTPWIQLPFQYYMRQARSDLELQSTPLPMFDDNQLEPLVTPDQLANIDAAIADQHRVWLVYSHFWYSDPEQLVPGRLMQILPHCTRQNFLWDIEVRLCANG